MGWFGSSGGPARRGAWRPLEPGWKRPDVSCFGRKLGEVEPRTGLWTRARWMGEDRGVGHQIVGPIPGGEACGEAGAADVQNEYPRVVKREGNRVAQDLVNSVFEVCDRKWRGVGLIPKSGKRFRVMATDIHTIESGRIRKTYHMENWFAAMLQLRS